MTSDVKQQFTLRITQANSTEMVVILYEMLLCYLDEGEEACKANDRLAFREAIRKSRGCINELLHSLNMEYEPAPALLQLYFFCIRRLAVCEVRNMSGCFGEIRGIIKPLRDAYSELARQNTQGPVMDNSQTVYSGLTYGRNRLSEDMTDNGSNRGMLI
ncbi:MAG: flagellar protein FliS [Lachnospiraceae bacterium]|nr:flagellar protein FliS [Lachnospiraceae bacterium]